MSRQGIVMKSFLISEQNIPYWKRGFGVSSTSTFCLSWQCFIYYPSWYVLFHCESLILIHYYYSRIVPILAMRVLQVCKQILRWPIGNTALLWLSLMYHTSPPSFRPISSSRYGGIVSDSGKYFTQFPTDCWSQLDATDHAHALGRCYRPTRF